jgi:hypothetical protein
MNLLVHPYKRFAVLLAALTLLQLSQSFSQTPADTAGRPTIRFASAIEAFLKTDSLTPPPTGGIEFIGSSIFRQWTQLEQHMAPLPVFNRAFGGSRTIEVLFSMDKIVLPYKPSIIVYYCGSNDINGNVPLDSIYQRFRQFSERAINQLPTVKILYVSIIKAPQKQKRWGAVDTVNALVRQYCSSRTETEFIDINPRFFDENGQPKLEYYKEDLLHYREPAYEQLAAVIKPYLWNIWKRE